MIAIELLVGILIMTVMLAGIVKIGAPLAEAFADRLKLKFQELGPEEERVLKARISSLEEEMRDLRRQVSSIQETADFAVKLLQNHEAGAGQLKEIDKVDIAPEKKKH